MHPSIHRQPRNLIRAPTASAYTLLYLLQTDKACLTMYKPHRSAHSRCSAHIVLMFVHLNMQVKHACTTLHRALLIVISLQHTHNHVCPQDTTHASAVCQFTLLISNHASHTACMSTHTYTHHVQPRVTSQRHKGGTPCRALALLVQQLGAVLLDVPQLVAVPARLAVHTLNIVCIGNPRAHIQGHCTLLAHQRSQHTGP